MQMDVLTKMTVITQKITPKFNDRTERLKVSLLKGNHKIHCTYTIVI